MNQPPFRIEVLAPTHQVGAFFSDNEDIDGYLRNQALAEHKQNLNRVYVMVDSSDHVRGYFTLSPLSVRLDEGLLRALGLTHVPYPNVGGYLLGRLGVQKNLQKQGFGASLVARAAQIARQQQDIVGGAFLAVDPKTDDLVRWYTKLGFVHLGGKSQRLVLPLGSVP